MITITRKSISHVRKLSMAIVVMLSLASVGALLYYNFLPMRYQWSLIAAVVILSALTIFGLYRARVHKISVISTYALTLLLIVAMGTGIYVLTKSGQMFAAIANNTGKTLSFSVVVLKESSISTEDQLRNSALSGASMDEKYVTQIQTSLATKKADMIASYPVLVKKLYDKETPAIVLNESYRALFEDVYPKLGTETRVIKTFTYTEKAAEQSKEKAFSVNEPFNLYISGIDTFGSIQTVSRSDVNIVATVNPKTRKILLTTIPRDAYVSIPLGGGNQKDKLTHAGIYGVEASQQALEQLLDTDIAVYARVNFTSLIDLVDKVGGIEVINPVAFKTDSGELFPSGSIYMNGKKALTYSRERHNLAGGDTDRGQNQQRVIEAIFRKLASPSILTNYQGIMSTVGRSVQTNLTNAQITDLVRAQLDSGASWNITSQNVTGKGQTGLPSYAMPSSKLYMYVLDDASLNATKKQISNFISD